MASPIPISTNRPPTNTTTESRDQASVQVVNLLDPAALRPGVRLRAKPGQLQAVHPRLHPTELGIGDAEIMQLREHPELGLQYQVQTFVWRNTFWLTHRELLGMFCEATLAQPQSESMVNCIFQSTEGQVTK